MEGSGIHETPPNLVSPEYNNFPRSQYTNSAPPRSVEFAARPATAIALRKVRGGIEGKRERDKERERGTKRGEPREDIECSQKIRGGAKSEGGRVTHVRGK